MSRNLTVLALLTILPSIAAATDGLIGLAFIWGVFILLDALMLLLCATAIIWCRRAEGRRTIGMNIMTGISLTADLCVLLAGLFILPTLRRQYAPIPFDEMLQIAAPLTSATLKFLLSRRRPSTA